MARPRGHGVARLALRARRLRHALAARTALYARAAGRAARASTGAILSFSGLACAPGAAFVTWGLAGLLWVAFPVLIVAGAAVERMLNAGT